MVVELRARTTFPVVPDLYQQIRRHINIGRSRTTSEDVRELIEHTSGLREIINRWPGAERLLLTYPGASQMWEQGGLLDEGWLNVVGHHIGAGLTANALCRLIGLPPEEVDQVTFFALTHDADKRREKEATHNGSGRQVGRRVYLETDGLTYDERESHKQGLLAATGDNAEGFTEWDIRHYIMRWTDSVVGPRERGGTDEVLTFSERIKDLRTRYSADTHPQLAKWWDELEFGVHPKVEAILYDLITSRPENKEWVAGTSKPEDLVHVVRKFIGLSN